MWRTRANIATTTAADDFAAAVGLARGNMGAGVCPVWQGAELIRDKWTNAASGQVQLTLNAYWNFGLVRESNFARVKFVCLDHAHDRAPRRRRCRGPGRGAGPDRARDGLRERQSRACGAVREPGRSRRSHRSPCGCSTTLA